MLAVIEFFVLDQEFINIDAVFEVPSLSCSFAGQFLFVKVMR
jgi:hypothetical protein